MKALAVLEGEVRARGGPFVELDVDEPVITTRAGVSAGEYTAAAHKGEPSSQPCHIRRVANKKGNKYAKNTMK